MSKITLFETLDGKQTFNPEEISSTQITDECVIISMNSGKDVFITHADWEAFKKFLR